MYIESHENNLYDWDLNIMIISLIISIINQILIGQLQLIKL